METPSPRKGTRFTGGVGIGIVGILAALAVVFGNASGTQQAANEAVAAQHLEATLGSLAAYRTTVGQALLVAEASPGNAAIPVLVDDVRLLSTQLEERFTSTSEAIDDAGLAITIDATELLSSSGAMAEALATGNTEAAGVSAINVSTAIDALSGTLTAARDQLVASLKAAGQQASRVATAARFMIALGVPGAAILSWAAFARKRRKRDQMEAALENERAINRSKDQLIANISHELRTPLTGIYAAALTLDDAMGPGADPELGAELMGVIVEQSIELTRMVEDLLVSAQADAQRLSLVVRDIDVEAAVKHVIEEFARTGTSVEARYEPGAVAADPLRLRQMLRNLVSNARNHGGARIWIEGAPIDHGYRLTVADDGDGVPDDIEDRLFTPFVHQGDRPLITGSVGLGLSITRLLAEAMGGTVAYQRGAGTTRFIVELPTPPHDPSPSLPNEILMDTGRERVNET